MTKTMLVSAFALMLLAACSGATVGVGGGADGGASSSSGGSSSGSSGSSGGSCTDKPLDGERICVPGTAKAGEPLTLAADGTGCVACGGTILPCQVAVNGTSITITATERDCQTNDLCPASCGLPQTTCTIPALSAGTYTVQFANASFAEDGTLRQLVVADDASATSCTLPIGDGPPVQASDFSQQCSGDSDCVMITEGTGCSVCSCPTAAIAKSDLAAYQAAYRERAAECRDSNNGQPECAACPTQKATCSGGKCAVALPK